MKQYVLGLDFGSLSGRALLINTENGKIENTVVMEYPHAIIDKTFIDGKILPPETALQHPQDYLDVLEKIVKSIIKESKITPEQIVSVGIDFTACSVLPVDQNWEPLCFDDKFKLNPSAYVMMWKHHGAQKYAEEITEKLNSLDSKYLFQNGGRLSAESLFPRLLQIYLEEPEIFQEMDTYVEAGDWIVYKLTGNKTRNICSAAYKSLYNPKTQEYLSPEVLETLAPGFSDSLDKLKGDKLLAGTPAGRINKEGSKLTGLKEGTPVSAAIVDGHAAIFGLIPEISDGLMIIITGTSSAHFVLSGREQNEIEGLFGNVDSALIPGYVGYEGGQSAVGDQFAWFVNNLVSSELKEEAKQRNLDIHKYLTDKAAKLSPGESGLIALDWWNGNRSTLVDNDLSGLIVGLNINTKPEEIYRALIESTAYGTRMILDTFEENDVPVNKIIISGGVAQKNPLFLQIYADVLGREITLTGSDYASGVGAAVLGFLATKEDNFNSLNEALKLTAANSEKVIKPIPKNVEIYNHLYDYYKQLYDYFGRNEKNLMHELKKIQKEATNHI